MTTNAISAPPHNGKKPGLKGWIKALRLDSPIVILTLGAILIANAYFTPIGIRFVIGFPLGFFLPGHCFVVTLFGKRLDLDYWQRGLIRLLLTCVVYPPLAIIVYVLQFDFTKTTRSACIAACCVLAAVVSFRRQSHGDSPRRVAVDDKADSLILPRGNFKQVWPILVSIPLGALGLTVAQTVLPHMEEYKFVEFGLSGSWAQLDNAAPVIPGSTTEVDLTVANHMDHDDYFVIQAQIGDIKWEPMKLELAPEEKWSGKIKGKMPDNSCLNRLQISLVDSSGHDHVAPLQIEIGDPMAEGCPAVTSG
jgi:uncharacterized membrane protein